MKDEKNKFESFEEELDDLILLICNKYKFDYLNFNVHTPKEGLRDITQHKSKGETEQVLYSVVEYKNQIVGTITTNDFVNKTDDEVWDRGIFRGNKPENRFMKLMRLHGLIIVGCSLRRKKTT